MVLSLLAKPNVKFQKKRRRNIQCKHQAQYNTTVDFIPQNKKHNFIQRHFCMDSAEKGYLYIPHLWTLLSNRCVSCMLHTFLAHKYVYSTNISSKYIACMVAFYQAYYPPSNQKVWLCESSNMQGLYHQFSSITC